MQFDSGVFSGRPLEKVFEFVIVLLYEDENFYFKSVAIRFP